MSDCQDTHIVIRDVGARGRSATQVAIDQGILPPGSTDEDFIEWLQSGFLPDALQQTVGWAVARGFEAGEDCTDALATLLEKSDGNWRIPPNDPDEPYLISAQTDESVLTRLNVDARGAHFKRNWTPAADARASFLNVDLQGSTWIGGRFDFDGQTLSTMSDDITTYPWSAVELVGGSTDSTLEIEAYNVPGFGVYSADTTTRVNVKVLSEGCTGAAALETPQGGEFRIIANNSTNRFNGLLTNVNLQVFRIREGGGFSVPVMRINGVRGKRNPSYGQFYSGFTVLNSTNWTAFNPTTQGFVNDEANEADRLVMLPQSYPAENFVLFAPRHYGAAELPLELIVTEGGWEVISPYIDQMYAMSLINSRCQGIAIKGGGFEEFPNRAGRNSTRGKPCILTNPIVIRTDGDAYRWRAAGVQVSGEAIAQGATGYGHLISHLDLASSGWGSGYAPQSERDRRFSNLTGRGTGKTPIAINNGKRLTFKDCRGNGAGWDALTREQAAGIGHVEATDDETGTGLFSGVIDSGDFTGTPHETVTDAMSFSYGLGEQVLEGTRWADADQRYVKWTNRLMGEIGFMWRVRDAMGDGIDALIRAIDLDGDTGGIVTKALQELSGTHSYNATSATLTGTGSAYLSELVVGQEIYTLDGTRGIVATVVSDTSATLELLPAFTGSFSGRVLERVLTTAPEWQDGGIHDVDELNLTDVDGNPIFEVSAPFLVALTGTVAINSGSKVVTGTGTSLDTEFKGPCFVKIGAHTYAARGVSSATSFSLMDAAEETLSGVTGYMILADAESFNPQMHSIRADTDFVETLQLLDPVVGGTIREPLLIDAAKVTGPSRVVWGGRYDFKQTPDHDPDVVTVPAGWRLQGASARIVKAMTGRTSPTSISLVAKDNGGATLETLGTINATGSTIALDSTTRGSFSTYAAFASAGSVGFITTGGSGSWSDGEARVHALLAFDAPDFPPVKGAQVL